MIRRVRRNKALAAEFVKFGLVGTLGFGVDSTVLYFAVWGFGADLYSARVVSFLVAATVTWVGNRSFTFRGRQAGRTHEQWARFLVVNALGGTINYATYAILVTIESPIHMYPILAVAAGSMAGLLFNYTGSRLLVFHPEARHT